MADLHDYYRRTNSRHNIVAFLESSHKNSIPFRPMIEFLRRSRIHYAITASTDIYMNQIEEFYDNALVRTVGDVPRIVSKMFGKEIEITEDTVRQVLRFADAHDMPTQFENTFILGGLLRMGYPEEHFSDFRKQYLCRVWRYLCHIVIVCLSPRKGGYDAASYSTLSLMLALVYNKDYNFSGYIFGHMVENVRAGKDKWLLYPRFVQLMLDSLNLGIAPDPRSKLIQTPMLLRIFSDCKLPAKDAAVLADRELFGHIVNVDYVAPPNDGYADVVPPIQDENLVDTDIQQDLRDIDRVGNIGEPESDGGSTPADSDGDVPPPAALDGIQLSDPRRFKRILRRISAGRVHVPPNRGKRPAGSTPSYTDLPLRRRQRLGVHIQEPVSQPQQTTPTSAPSVDLQLVLARMEQMTKRLDDQAAVIEAQAAQIRELEVVKLQVTDLQSRILELESVTHVSGEFGDRIETHVTTPPESQDVPSGNINENIVLEYFASSEQISGQPLPLNVDYSHANIEYLQNLVFGSASDEGPSIYDDDVDMEPEEVSEEEVVEENPYENNDSEDESSAIPQPTESAAPESSSPPVGSASTSSGTTSMKHPDWWIPSVPELKKGRHYSVKGDLCGLIKSWKYDANFRLFVIKRKDGIQYFKARLNHLSTLPKVDLNRLAQLNLINPTNDFKADFMQKILRREINGKKYKWIRPVLGIRFSNKKKLDPRTNQPIFSYHYPPTKNLTKIPFEILPLDFLGRLRSWYYDSVTGEAVVDYYSRNAPEKASNEWKHVKGSTLRVYDPLSLINLSKDDLKVLNEKRITYYPIDRSEALKFQRVVDLCVEKGIHAGGNLPANWT